ncbi:HAMP domain-containing sensor histidine kinase [Radiobacillus deserti]|uniref:histidine kinase n=1 Tax=Radiobacillus deserti TaxID=2594883 RepID=A0A516KJD2_9BACI|nr:HAMP domain-containing sensor histidine kinase [Radiobacillus deserti]QDP41498.1 HAMP domain-containing protein [Radiobacillus deserti]
MKKGIVWKLFLLTTLLCTLILAAIFVGQTVFFKQYYEYQKVNEIKKSIQTFKDQYVKAKGDPTTIEKLEQKFYEENTTWITTVDSAGNIRNADDFSVRIQVEASKYEGFSNREITIPLYSFISLEDLDRTKFYLDKGNHILIDGIMEKDKLVPIILMMENQDFMLENMLLSKKVYGKKSLRKPAPQQPAPQESAPNATSQVYLKGEIQKLQLPLSTIGQDIYSNTMFLDRIKQFQVDLLLNKKDIQSAETVDYEENDIKYKIFIEPIENQTGETIYIYAMTSLQPVDEAVQMIQDYYAYFIIFVLLLIILVSFYYSKKIAKPLIQINETTEKIANLDFSETIPISSKDEIGALSQNINKLSDTLHSHINQLQQDIEKEKQLENTRKEFISGVSHELKTPLSILKSCISILEDGVASNKKEHYFIAMSKEVDKMDMLIVDMLELAKYESGTYKMEMDVFYIDQVIAYICDQLAPEIAKKQLHVEQQLANLKVVANQNRIEQVLTNFITNAIRYTPEHNLILISTIEENDRVKICVENKGAHIKQEQLEKIWDRFYRGDTSRRRSKGGTGLGLAISKNILDLHGSEYGVYNTEDGVLFFFYLNKD